MDLIMDSHSRSILSIVECSINMPMMEELKHGKKAKSLAKEV